jgi:hypothetical protein
MGKNDPKTAILGKQRVKPKRANAGPRNQPVCRNHGSPTCPPNCQDSERCKFGHLPFELPNKYDLVMNLKIAQAPNFTPCDLLLVAEIADDRPVLAHQHHTGAVIFCPLPGW